MLIFLSFRGNHILYYFVPALKRLVIFFVPALKRHVIFENNEDKKYSITLSDIILFICILDFFT